MRKKTLWIGVLLLALLLPAFHVKAATLPSKEEMSEFWFNFYDASGQGEEWVIFPRGTKLSDFKTSSKNVTLSMEKKEYQGKTNPYLVIRTKRAGNSRIRFTAKLGKKSVRYKATVQARRYRSPIRTLKIGKKNYASLFKDFDRDQNLTGKISGKVNVKTNKGFKLTGMMIVRDDEECFSIDVENGQKISMGPGESLIIVCFNKKYKCYDDVILGIPRE